MKSPWAEACSGDVISRIHEEVGARVGSECLEGRIDRVGRRTWLRPAVLRDEREVHVLDPGASGAGGIEVGIGDRVTREAVDVEGGAPLRGIAAVARGPVHPARRVELHLHEGNPRMVRAHGRVDDVAVAVRRAGGQQLRERLRIAHRHAKPEGGMELEVEGIGGGLRRIARQRQLILHPVSRAGLVGVEQHRGFVMANVDPLTEHLFGVEHLRTGDPALRTIERHMGRGGGSGWN